MSTPVKIPDFTPAQRASFMARFESEPTDECQLWTGAMSATGYGKFSGSNGRRFMAHRLAYHFLVGTIPAGMFIDHIYHNTACVNIRHLRPVTPRQNMQHRKGATRASASGVRGVSWDPQRGKWKCQVIHKGQKHFGGRFDDLREAAEAARLLRLELHTHSDKDRTVASD